MNKPDSCQIVVVPHYTERQAAERQRLLSLIEAERRSFEARIKPYVDALVDIESTVTHTTYQYAESPK
jgi:hypothetical protein